MIRIEKLTKTYRKIAALSGVDLVVPAGELFGYLGPNGAGKSTTIRILTGLTRCTSGDAWINGHHIEKAALSARMQCGLVPQSVNLDQELTLLENLDIHGRLFHMKRKERSLRIHELLVYVGLLDRATDLVKTLSGGMKRRLMIARALLHSPRILFLDEPTAGLDPAIRRRIWALILRIQQSGATIFLTTHYIEEAEFLAERVAFLHEGKIVAVDSPKALKARMGSWALDRVVDAELSTACYPSRKEAAAAAAALGVPYTLRRVNLEDSFLAITGEKVK